MMSLIHLYLALSTQSIAQWTWCMFVPTVARDGIDWKCVKFIGVACYFQDLNVINCNQTCFSYMFNSLKKIHKKPQKCNGLD